MIDYKITNNKGFRFIFIKIDDFSKVLLCIPLKNKNSPTFINEFSNIFTTSKRKTLKIKSDRGTEFYSSMFQNFLKTKNIRHYSRYTDKGPSIAERVIRTIRILLKKPIFLGNADWLSELSAVVNKYNNTIHHSKNMTPSQASKKANEKKVYCNLQDRRIRQQLKFKLGQLVRTVDIKNVFSKIDSTIWSYKFYTIPEVIHDTIPSYRIDYLPERYSENFLLPRKLSHEQNKKVMKDLNLIQ